MFRYPFFLIMLLICQSVQSQSGVSGRVVSKATGKPIPYASVYFNNTTIGTTTDPDGRFELSEVPSGKSRLVVSCIGFATFAEIIDIQGISKEVNIALTPRPQLLKDVDVLPFDPNGWRKWGKLFTEIFIGTNPYSDRCILENPDVVKFRLNADNTLTVVASEPLRIRNSVLGYEITYKLEEFEYNFNSLIVAYNGYAFFKDLSASRPKRAIKWKQKRLETYQGSLMQFMRAFFVNKLGAAGFELHDLALISNPEKDRAKLLFSLHKDSILKTIVDTENIHESHIIKTIVHYRDSTEYFKEKLSQPDSVISHQPVIADSIGFAIDSSTAGLYFSDSLEVSNPAKGLPDAYKKLSKSHRYETFPVSQFVFLNKKPVFVLSNGYYYGPHDLKITGFWAWWETMATMLPYNYWPTKN